MTAWPCHWSLALGIAVPLGIATLVKIRVPSASDEQSPLLALAIGLLLLALASLSGFNEYLAAFSGGVAVATLIPRFKRTFAEFGELIAELFKLAALLAFGALPTPHFLSGFPWQAYLFVLLSLFAFRPLAILLALLGSGLGGRERLAAAWFGLRGFATVVYGIHILQSHAPYGADVARLGGLVVVGSIVAHSSTDVLVARWFRGK